MTKEVQGLKKELSRLKGLVYKDPLTGVYNRRGFLEEAGKMFKTAYETAHHKIMRKKFFVRDFSVIFADIDNFKKLNDKYGHNAGDAALKALAEVFVKHLRDNDIVGRFGGEEFVVALVGASGNDAELVAENLREKVERMSVAFRGKKIYLTASFGVAGMKKESTLDNLVKRADKAMYQAKKAGKNRVVRAR
ncbi:MAG: GGDEF domain-containing protein [Candidatus Colwellbacteria bacterium]|nr:GGDEF domain-containing protein [Candidatus Colwellbacteria bacterium]